MNVTIIGMGNLGSSLAYVIANNGHRVVGWEIDQAVVDAINYHHINERYLANTVFPDLVSATIDFQQAIHCADVLFICLPTRFIYDVLLRQQVPKTMKIVNMSKGFDRHSGETSCQLIARLLPDNSLAMVSGPSLANEFVHGVVTGFIAASTDPSLLGLISQLLNSETISVRYSDDTLGTELGGVLKNIYALGLGLFDGQVGSGLNFVGAYFALALEEMKRLGQALGAHQSAFDQLSGIGDLIATALSENSHNRTMGKYLAQGKNLTEIEKKMGVFPEGYISLDLVLRLAAEKGVEMPLAQLISTVLKRDFNSHDFFTRFIRLLKS